MAPERAPGPIWALLRLGWARGGRAVGVLDVWLVWERLLSRLQGIRPIRPGGGFRYSVRRHGGGWERLAAGGWVGPGAVLIELHLDNRRFAELTRDGVSGPAMLRLLREDLRELASLIAGGHLGPVAALHGVTFLAAAAPALGFETRALPHSLHLRLERFFLTGLVLLYHAGGWPTARRYATRWPGEVWFSTGELARRYPAGEPRASGRS